MKFAFALFRYFPFGGLQKDMLAIAHACVAAGHEVTVFTGSWEGERPPGIAVQVLPATGASNHSRNRSFVDALQARLRSTPFDLVAGFDRMPGLDVYYAADTCFRAKLELERPFFYRYLPRYRQFLQYEETIFKQDSACEILLIAARSADEYRRYYHTPPSRMHLLPPGISIDRKADHTATSRRSAKRSELGLADADNLLLFVGSGFRTKGLDRAILALGHLPVDVLQCTQLFVAGQDRANTCIALAKSAGVADRVHFLGGRNDVADLLLAADLLVHPARRENTGTVLLEAAIAGLPVLTTDVCGYAHYITEANAGVVLASPFVQTVLDATLAQMLQQRDTQPWSANGIAFGNTADIYSLPQHACTLMAGFANRKAQ